MGLLELPHPAVDGPGKGPLLVAEQFALQQGFGDGHAVDDQKGFGRPQAVLVDGPGHQFLAGAGFPPDEHGGVGGRHPADGLVDLLHGLAAADDGVRRGRRPGATSISTRERMKRPASRAWPIKARISGISKGLRTYSKAPSLVASMAVSVVP